MYPKLWGFFTLEEKLAWLSGFGVALSLMTDSPGMRVMASDFLRDAKAAVDQEI